MTTRVGSSEGNRFWIQAPNAQYSGIGDGDRAGLVVANVDLLLHELGSGGNELVLIYA